MTDRLVVQLNRTGIHSVDVPETFETEGSFVVVLQNHGEATHAHLHLGEQLSEIGRLDATNHYLDGNTARRVSVDIDAEPETRRRGRLKIVAGHGARTRYVSVVIDTTGSTVRVDPALSTPSTEPSTAVESLDPLAVGAVASGVLCLLLAVAAVLAAAANAVFAVFAVLAGLLAAGLFAIR